MTIEKEMGGINIAGLKLNITKVRTEKIPAIAIATNSGGGGGDESGTESIKERESQNQNQNQSQKEKDKERETEREIMEKLKLITRARKYGGPDLVPSNEDLWG
jgi:hypothetical protein